MKFVLGTDTLIYFLKGQANIVKTLSKKDPEQINTTIINKAELFFGIFNSENKKNNLKLISDFIKNIEILPFCDNACYIFGEQKAILKKNGTLLADMDLMIASICLVNQMTLVTNNVKHFIRLPSLKIENWV